MTEVVRYGIVIPTIGRPSLAVLLRALDQAATVAAGPEKVVVVDDRTGDGPPLDVGSTALDLRVVRSDGKGPAAARNRGWRALPADLPWVVFLDDDVIVSSDWCERLRSDLAPNDAPGRDHVGASSAILSVPVCQDVDRLMTNGAPSPSMGPAGSPPTWPSGATSWTLWMGSTNDSRERTGRTPTSPCARCPQAGRWLRASGSASIR